MDDFCQHPDETTDGTIMVEIGWIQDRGYCENGLDCLAHCPYSWAWEEVDAADQALCKLPADAAL